MRSVAIGLRYAGYYETFTHKLDAHFAGTAHIWTVASLGFSSIPNSASGPTQGHREDTVQAQDGSQDAADSTQSGAVPATAPPGGRGLKRPVTFTLAQQTQHKMEALLHVLQLHRLPVLLVGHSIGYYMALHALLAIEKHAGAPYTCAAGAPPGAARGRCVSRACVVRLRTRCMAPTLCCCKSVPKAPYCYFSGFAHKMASCQPELSGITWAFCTHSCFAPCRSRQCT